MHDAVVGLLEKVDAALAESVDVIGESDIAELRAVRDRVETRLDYPTDVLIVALAGGTGSGKSSLFNAIAGREVAEAGGIRPTTSEAMGLVAPITGSEVASYLGNIGVKVTETPEVPDWLCVIDLPDTDSIALANATSAEELVSRVDAIVWVADPQKYGDASLHNRFISSMLDYEDQFLFVLNQADRITPADRAAVREDFTRTLLDTGLSAPRVFVTMADPPSGPPDGVDRLLDAIKGMSSEGSPGYRKLLLDLGGVGRDLVDLTEGASSIGFDERWEAVSADAASAISKGDSALASHLLSAFLEVIGSDFGGEAGKAIASAALDAPRVVDRAHDRARSDLGPTNSRGVKGRSFFGFLRKDRAASDTTMSAPLPIEGIRETLEEEIARPIRESLNNRARFHAAILDLHLSALALLEHGS